MYLGTDADGWRLTQAVRTSIRVLFDNNKCNGFKKSRKQNERKVGFGDDGALYDEATQRGENTYDMAGTGGGITL